MVANHDGSWVPFDTAAYPFGIPNHYTRAGLHVASYRMIGVLDMAAAIRDDRPHPAAVSWPCTCWRCLRRWDARRSRAPRQDKDYVRAARAAPAGPGRRGVCAVRTTPGGDS